MVDYIRRSLAEEAIEEYVCRRCEEYNELEGGCISHAMHCTHLSGEEILKPVENEAVQPIYYAENVQNEVLNYLFNKEREAESMSYGDKRQERIATIREIIRFVEDIDPRMEGDT